MRKLLLCIIALVVMALGWQTWRDWYHNALKREVSLVTDHVARANTYQDSLNYTDRCNSRDLHLYYAGNGLRKREDYYRRYCVPGSVTDPRTRAANANLYEIRSVRMQGLRAAEVLQDESFLDALSYKQSVRAYFCMRLSLRKHGTGWRIIAEERTSISGGRCNPPQDHTG